MAIRSVERCTCLPVTFEVYLGVILHLPDKKFCLLEGVGVRRDGEGDVESRVRRQKFSPSRGVSRQTRIELLQDIRQRQVVPPGSLTAWKRPTVTWHGVNNSVTAAENACNAKEDYFFFNLIKNAIEGSDDILELHNILITIMENLVHVF